MIVIREAESRDLRVPYTRMAAAEQKVREQLRRDDEEFVAVRALWTPANEDSDVHVEIWRGRGKQLDATVVRP